MVYQYNVRMYACMQIIPTRIRVFWYADYTYDVRRLLYAKYPFVREFWYADLVRRLYLQRTRVSMYADYISPSLTMTMTDRNMEACVYNVQECF